MVNVKPAAALSAIGFPGATDGYQVNVRAPSDAAKGPATIHVSAAWIAGAAINIMIQSPGAGSASILMAQPARCVRRLRRLGVRARQQTLFTSGRTVCKLF